MCDFSPDFTVRVLLSLGLLFSTGSCVLLLLRLHFAMRREFGDRR